MNEHKHKPSQIDTIAEQWVNLLFAHINHKKLSKKHKRENKNGAG